MGTIRESEIGLDPKAESTLSTSTIRVLHLDDEEQQMFLKVFIEGEPNIKVLKGIGGLKCLLI